MTPLSPPTQRILIQEPKTKLRKSDCVAWKICPSFSSIAGTNPKATWGGGRVYLTYTFWSWSTGEGSWDKNSNRVGTWRQEPKQVKEKFLLLTCFKCSAPPTILHNAEPSAQMWLYLWWTGPATLIISQDNAPQTCLSISQFDGSIFSMRFPSHMPPAWIWLAKVKAAPSPPCEFETHLQRDCMGICISLSSEVNIDLQQACNIGLVKPKWRLVYLVIVLRFLKCVVLFIAVGDSVYLALSRASNSGLYLTTWVFEWLPLLTKIMVSVFDQYLFNFSNPTFQ